MITTSDNLTFANKAAVETFLTLANTAFASAERLTALNLHVARSLLDDGMANAKTLLGAKDAQQLLALQTALAQPTVEKFASYSRSVLEIATQTQQEMSKIVESQFVEANKNVVEALDKAAKNAPAGSDAAIAAVKSAIATANSAYEKISKASKQVVELAQANLAAATNATVKSAGATAKAKRAA